MYSLQWILLRKHANLHKGRHHFVMGNCKLDRILRINELRMYILTNKYNSWILFLACTFIHWNEYITYVKWLDEKVSIGVKMIGGNFKVSSNIHHFGSISVFFFNVSSHKYWFWSLLYSTKRFQAKNKGTSEASIFIETKRYP